MDVDSEIPVKVRNQTLPLLDKLIQIKGTRKIWGKEKFPELSRRSDRAKGNNLKFFLLHK
jgi:hypothetical protein